MARKRTSERKRSTLIFRFEGPAFLAPRGEPRLLDFIVEEDNRGTVWAELSRAGQSRAEEGTG